MARRKKPVTQNDGVDKDSLPEEGHGSESERDEDSVVPTETASPAADDTVPVYQDTVQDTVQDVDDEETVLVATADSVAAESPIEPEAGIVEAAVAENFEVLAELGKEELKAAEAITREFSNSFQTFANETAVYSKNHLENWTAFIGALLGAKSVQGAVQIQSSYVYSARARFVAHLLKMSGLYWRLPAAAAVTGAKVTAGPERLKA